MHDASFYHIKVSLPGIFPYFPIKDHECWVSCYISQLGKMLLSNLLTLRVPDKQIFQKRVVRTKLYIYNGLISKLRGHEYLSLQSAH